MPTCRLTIHNRLQTCITALVTDLQAVYQSQIQTLIDLLRSAKPGRQFSAWCLEVDKFLIVSMESCWTPAVRRRSSCAICIWACLQSHLQTLQLEWGFQGKQCGSRAKALVFPAICSVQRQKCNLLLIHISLQTHWSFAVFLANRRPGLMGNSVYSHFSRRKARRRWCSPPLTGYSPLVISDAVILVSLTLHWRSSRRIELPIRSCLALMNGKGRRPSNTTFKT